MLNIWSKLYFFTCCVSFFFLRVCITILLFHTEVVNVLADTLGYWKTAGTEDLGTEMTEDVVKDFIYDYYWKYPDKYDDDIKSDKDYDDLVQKCLKSKKKIREKQRIMADAVSSKFIIL